MEDTSNFATEPESDHGRKPIWVGAGCTTFAQARTHGYLFDGTRHAHARHALADSLPIWSSSSSSSKKERRDQCDCDSARPIETNGE